VFTVLHGASNGSENARVFEDRVKLRFVLEQLPLHSTLGVSREIEQFGATTLRTYSANGGLSASHTAELQRWRRRSEGFPERMKERQVVIVNEIRGARRFQKIPDALPYLSRAQHILHEEVIRSLRVENYRSAIVMAWAFAYDYLRTWVFSDHRADFNSNLTSVNPRSGRSAIRGLLGQKPPPGE